MRALLRPARAATRRRDTMADAQPRDGSTPAPPRPRPAPPDHFFALRVPLVLAQPPFDLLHAALGPRLGETLVDAASAHVTLGVVRLAGDDDAGAGQDETEAERWAPRPPDPARLASAVAALHSAAASLPAPLTLSLDPHGLGTFGRRVVYLGVRDGGCGAGLRGAEAAVGRALEEVGLVEAGGRPAAQQQSFTPHVTVAKVRWGGRVRFIPPAAVAAADTALKASGWAGARFEVGALQLCAMGGRVAGEYYRVVEEVEFSV